MSACPQPSAQHFLEQGRQKQYKRYFAKTKNPVSYDRWLHLSECGNKSWFKRGQNVGSKSSRWKGGYYFYTYGITNEQYDEMLKQQGGVCAICQRPPTKKRLNVDHDHKTKKVRGLLCFRCNYGLSWFQDHPECFERAVKHLKGELYSTK